MLRIETMYAFVSVDEMGDEGVIAFYDPAQDVWMPMVGADLAMIEYLRPKAEMTASATGRPVRLCHFTTRTEVEEITP
jgi:acyl-coenzyme A thioesterase PaaI-like protein